MNIEYTERNVFGHDRKFPANADARFVCALANTKTVTDWMITLLTKTGHTVERAR